MGSLPKYPIPENLREVLDNEFEIVTSEESQVYMKVLNIWKKAKCIDVTQSHYLQLLKMALYLEEYQCEIDMEMYDLIDKSILKTDTSVFRINTDEWLDDENPTIRPTDLIDIVDTNNNKSYTLLIKSINKKSIEASSATFQKVYSEKKLYNIQFRYNNYPMRCRHYALTLAHQRNILTYLFPTNLTQSCHSTIYSSANVNFYNPTIKSNSKQVQAVLNILHKSSYPYPYILYGPPGTGKTATIVESICQIVKDSSNRVLACTPSNTAADEVTKRLLDYIGPELVYRMYSRSKDPLTIDEKILPCCNCESEKISFLKSEEIVRKRIVITTLCNCIRLIHVRLRKDHFSHVIIDEAGQSVEPDILIPVSLVSGNGKIHSHIVLAGDPKQLGPTVMSKLAEVVLGRSILERLMSYSIYQEMPNGEYMSKFIVKLLVNYRSRPEIIKIPNELFYNNELIPKFTITRDEFPVIFYGVFGKEEKSPNSTSSYNRKEIDMISRLIEHIMRNKRDWDLGRNIQEDIGVVTPFKLQSKEIKKELHERKLRKIDVGTVELFQGQEKKIIIVSAVRSQKFSRKDGQHIGCLSNPKRFNVAVTRAKNILIIVGNPKALQTDPSWRYILKYCIANKSYYGPHFQFNAQDNCASSYPLNASEIVISSDLFQWKKLKIFALGNQDSKAEVMETWRVILQSDRKSVQATQPTTSLIKPVLYMKSVPVLKINPPVDSIQSIERTQLPSQSKSIQETKSILAAQSIRPIQSMKPIPTVRKTTISEIKSIHSKPIHSIKPVLPYHSVPISEIQPAPSISSQPIPKIKPVRPIQFVTPTAPIQPQSILEIKPIRQIQAIQSVTPTQLTSKKKKRKCCIIS